MKKVLCVILCLALLLPCNAALGAAYPSELALPAHVRALKAEFDEGEYGEVFQLFSRDYLRVGGYFITVYEKNGEITLLRETSDLYGNTDNYFWFSEETTITADEYQKLKDFVSESGFDSLPDYVNYGEHGEYQTFDYYYTHITPEGVSYVQMDDPGEDSGVYAELVRLMHNFSSAAGYSLWYERNETVIEEKLRPLKEAFDSGELGDEVYQLTETRQFAMMSDGPTIVISVKDGQAVITTPERDKKRVLTMDEYQRLVGHIALYDFDNKSSVRGDRGVHGYIFSYTHITADGVSFVNMLHPNYETTYEYALLCAMFQEFYEKEELEPVSGPLWGELTEAPEPVRLSVNGEETGFNGRNVGGYVHAELTPGLLRSLGISRIERPDLDSIVLYRGTKLLLLNRGSSIITEIDASGIDDPRALAAELMDESAADKSFVKIAPMGTTVVNKRFPVRAAIEAFGGEVTWNGGENRVDIVLAGGEEGLSPEYVNIVVSLLTYEDEEEDLE